MNFITKPHILYLVILLFLSCDSDDYPHSETPSVVLNEFYAEFPNATEVEFRKAGENYEVEFELKEKDSEAILAPQGAILKEKREISWDSLPAEVRQVLEKQYNEQEVNPELVLTGDSVYYQVQIERFLTDKEVVLDETGKLRNSHDYWK